MYCLQKKNKADKLIDIIIIPNQMFSQDQRAHQGTYRTLVGFGEKII